jgi:hypothetical protein
MWCAAIVLSIISNRAYGESCLAVRNDTQDGSRQLYDALDPTCTGTPCSRCCGTPPERLAIHVRERLISQRLYLPDSRVSSLTARSESTNSPADTGYSVTVAYANKPWSTLGPPCTPKNASSRQHATAASTAMHTVLPGARRLPYG